MFTNKMFVEIMVRDEMYKSKMSKEEMSIREMSKSKLSTGKWLLMLYSKTKVHLWILRWHVCGFAAAGPYGWPINIDRHLVR